MWFFGNLYEAIVITPNILENSIQRLHSFQAFFVVTNPVFFYVPISQLAIIAIVIVYFKTPVRMIELKRKLKRAVIFLLIAFVLSIYIITQINMKLFFGDLEKYASEVPTKALLWNILNIIRLILLATSLTYIFKSYIQVQREKV